MEYNHSMNTDKEKDLIEKINRLEEKIDNSNNIQKTLNRDLKKQIDWNEVRLEEKIDNSNNIQKTLNRDLKKQVDNQEGGLGILFWGGVVAIIIFAFVL